MSLKFIRRDSLMVMGIKVKGRASLTLGKLSSSAYVAMIAMAFLATSWSQSKAQSQPKGLIIDKIITKVDDFVILRSDLEKLYLDLLSQGMVKGPEEKCNILESLITQKMLLAQAEIDSVEVLAAEVSLESERRMAYLLSQLGGSEEELEAYYGKPLEQIQNELQDDLMEQMTVSRMREEITADVSVTPSEVRKFFNSIPRDSLPYFSEEVTVAQIVKIPKVTRQQKDETRALLLDLKDRIKNGEDFGALAMKHSEDPGSASKGGEYTNYIKRGQFVAPFEAAAFSMKVGDISEPVETDFGFHLIQLLDRRGNEYKVRHILKSPRITQKNMEDASSYLDSIRTVLQEDEAVSFEQMAKDISDEKITGQNGGYFLDQIGSDRIAVNQLEPDVYFSLENLEVGDISEPMQFRMASGKQAVRILYYKAKYRPHQANLKEDWQKIHQAALNEKKSRQEKKWFDESKRNFFLLIDPQYDHCNLTAQ